MTETGPIELARAADFRLGPLLVRPSLRQVTREGASETLEPRVMQVLVLLAEAGGGIVSRDQLIERCWNGRVVGEDAINRAISRLRRLSEGLGRGGFRIETVTKVGYRLVEAGAMLPGSPATTALPRPIDRRLLLLGVGAGGVGLASAGWWVARRLGPERQAAVLVDRAALALQDGVVESIDQAIGLSRQAIEIAPHLADAWGLLALCYALAAQARAAQLEGEMRMRAEEAAARAAGLERRNAYAALARAALLPRLGRWKETRVILEEAFHARPDDRLVRLTLGEFAFAVGRRAEAAGHFDATMSRGAASPSLFLQALGDWAAGRREDADRVIEQAFSLFPGHFAVWQTRFHLRLFSSRPEEALAFNANVEGRPVGLPEATFALNAVIAKAMVTRLSADIDSAIARALAAARAGAGYAENAVLYAAGLGRLDTAFDVARGYFLDEGFTVADLRFSREQRIYTRPANRRTRFLFLPPAAPLRADARFAALTRSIGLADYWRESGRWPDAG